MTHSIQILNLKCDGCATSIKKALSALNGVNHVEVDNKNDIVTFDTDDSHLSEVASTLDKLGYPPVEGKNNLFKRAKSYVSCMIGRMEAE